MGGELLGSSSSCVAGLRWRAVTWEAAVRGSRSTAAMIDGLVGGGGVDPAGRARGAGVSVYSLPSPPARRQRPPLAARAGAAHLSIPAARGGRPRALASQPAAAWWEIEVAWRGGKTVACK